MNPFSPISDIIDDISKGHMVIMLDDDGRENEGDLILAAQYVSDQSIAFMASHGRGLICLALHQEISDCLALKPMVEQNETSQKTAFMRSIGSRLGITTGISAHDRAHTIQTAICGNAQDILSPGHVFPVLANPLGVLGRPGHTEAAVDLARLAGCSSAGVMCEIMKEDGKMARLPDLVLIARRYRLKLGTIADLIAYRHDYKR
jgi:3,4-dihydroxy 2-butanone 4-phosphate synthase/GTP cyclohydrolase II